MSRLVFLTISSIAAFAVSVASASAAECAPEIGKHVFETKCAMCHSVDKTKGTIVGPNLAGVVDRPIGRLSGFTYSPALANAQSNWDIKALDAFLKAPMTARPGTAMPFTGIKNDADRASTICYLKQQS